LLRRHEEEKEEVLDAKIAALGGTNVNYYGNRGEEEESPSKRKSPSKHSRRKSGLSSPSKKKDT
jgi:hypothetical protein